MESIEYFVIHMFKNLALFSRYVCVYLDATYIPVKHDTVSKEAIYITVGIREDGSKEVLSYTIAPTESAFIWKELLGNLKERGVSEIPLFISDGPKGITDSIFTIFPDTQYQSCLVHISRNIAQKVRVTNRAEIWEDFKSVYRAASKELSEEALQHFVERWGTSYPKVTKSLLGNPYLFTFYHFPESIRKSIYSTNLIESFNKQIKKYSKRKEQFPNEESLERFFVSQFDA